MEAYMKIFNRLLISLITCFLFIVAVGAEEPTTEDIQEPLFYNIEETTEGNTTEISEEPGTIIGENGNGQSETTEGTSEVAETVIDKNVNELSQTTENVETTVDENASTENEIPPAEENPTVESLPELATFEKEIIYNEDHTIATVAITYEGECDELTIANQEGIQELVNIGVYQVDMERSDWVNTIVFNILLNGAFHFDINVWSAEDLIGTGTVVGYITGLNNDALVFEPNQTEQSTYTTVSSDVGISDSQSLEISYVTNVSYTWSIPTALDLSDIKGSLPITINNSNLAPETALRVRINTANGFNLTNSEVADDLSYIVTDNNGNRVHDGDVILDHLFNQDTSSNTLNVDITRMPVYSGEYNDTWTFTASVERLLSDLYSGQVVTINQLGTTHKLIDMKIYGISKQDGTPTPDNPIEIQNVFNPSVKVYGKNLIDSSKIKNGNLVTGDLYENSEEKNYVTDFISVEDGENYILSGNCAKSSHENAWYDKSKKYIDRTFGEKLTVPSGACYVRIEFSNTVEFNNIQMQLEKGSTATDFVPYVEPQTVTLPCILNAIPVESGGNVTIDGQQYIADYVDIENKQLVRMVGDVNLGTLNWLLNYKYFDVNIGDFNAKTTDSQWDVPNGLCKMYKSVAMFYITNDTNRTDNSISWYNNGIIRITSSSYTDANTFKQAMSGVKLIYELATPTITDLTDEEVQAFKDLYTYSPTTVVSASSEELTPYIEFGLS